MLVDIDCIKKTTYFYQAKSTNLFISPKTKKGRGDNKMIILEYQKFRCENEITPKEKEVHEKQLVTPPKTK